MPEYAFETVDVFTDRRFGGNPLAVFPDAQGLSDADMQALATEFNLSETSFVLPPADPSHTARVRIFTPKAEVPFAGHPNVGTAVVLGSRMAALPATMVFEELAGLVHVSLARYAGVTSAVIDAPQPLQVGAEVPVDLAAACAGLRPDDFRTGVHSPIMAGVGFGFVFAEVDRAALSRAAPDSAAFHGAAARTGIEEVLLHLYARDGDTLHARMFAPSSGIPEDPATGSANAALAALLLSLDGRDHAAWTVRQGVEMGRPSLLHATAHRTPDGIRASIGGGVVPMMRGVVTL